MTPQRHLVVFLKAPRLGAVKTRLAADIGRMAALRFYRQTAGNLLRGLASDPRWLCWLAVTPDTALHAPGLGPGNCPRIAQGATL